jgi:hypothetical protein
MFDRKTIIYGLVLATALFFAGWLTGMGGPFWVNLFSSIFLGAAAAVSLAFIKKYGKPKE